MIAEELNVGCNALGTLCRFHPLTMGMRDPYGTEEPQNAILGISTIMVSHDGFDGLGGFVAVIEWDFGEIVVHDVRFNDAMHEVAANEAKLAVDCGSSSTGEGPCSGIVVWQAGVGVLQVCNPDYDSSQQSPEWTGARSSLPSQLLTHKYGAP